MTDYKLVPVELLKDWHERINTIAAEMAFNVADEMGAMLAASPAVQGGPVVVSHDWDDQDKCRRCGDRDWYAGAACTPKKPAEQQTAPHPDDAAVDRFAVAMKDKLAASREKGRHGWQNATAPHLSALLYDHMYKADPLDVGNLAMMLHQNGQAIELPHEVRKTAAQPAPDVSALVDALDDIAKLPIDPCSTENDYRLSAANAIANAALAAYRKQVGEA